MADDDPKVEMVPPGAKASFAALREQGGRPAPWIAALLMLIVLAAASVLALTGGRWWVGESGESTEAQTFALGLSELVVEEQAGAQQVITYGEMDWHELPADWQEVGRTAKVVRSLLLGAATITFLGVAGLFGATSSAERRRQWILVGACSSFVGGGLALAAVISWSALTPETLVIEQAVVQPSLSTGFSWTLALVAGIAGLAAAALALPAVGEHPRALTPRLAIPALRGLLKDGDDGGGAWRKADGRALPAALGVFAMVLLIVATVGTAVAGELAYRRAIADGPPLSDWMAIIRKDTESGGPLDVRIDDSTVVPLKLTILAEGHTPSRHVTSIVVLIDYSETDEIGQWECDDLEAKLGVTLDTMPGWDPARSTLRGSAGGDQDCANDSPDIALNITVQDELEDTVALRSMTEAQAWASLDNHLAAQGNWTLNVSLNVNTPPLSTGQLNDDGEDITVTWSIRYYEVEIQSASSEPSE